MPVAIALTTHGGARQDHPASQQPDPRSDNNAATSDDEPLSRTEDNSNSTGSVTEESSTNEPPSPGAATATSPQEQPGVSTPKKKSRKEIFWSMSGTWIGTTFGLAALVVALYFGLWSLRLQRWTAAKDFRDQCQIWSQKSTTLSPECALAFSQGPNPPPTSYRLGRRLADLNVEKPISHMIYEQAWRDGRLLIAVVAVVLINLVFSTFIFQVAQPNLAMISYGVLTHGYSGQLKDHTAFEFAWSRALLDRSQIFGISCRIIFGIWVTLNAAVIFSSTWLRTDSGISSIPLLVFTLVGSFYFARMVGTRKLQRAYRLEARNLERQIQGEETAVVEKREWSQEDNLRKRSRRAR